jgi:hypothetical protein
MAGLARGAIAELVDVERPGAPVRVLLAEDAAIGTKELAVAGPPEALGLIPGRQYWLRPLQPLAGGARA